MKWYKDKPEEGDLVVVNVTDVDKNSAYAQLEEYNDLTGLIHISEVSRSWVQDVGKVLDEGEKTVAQVIEVDEQDNINLSIKRVNDKQKRETMARWNKEQKAEKFVKQLGEETGKDEQEIYEEVIFPLQEEFDSSFHGFEISVGKEDQLEQILDEDLVESIQKIAKDNIDLKQEKLEGEIRVEFSEGDGLERIKDAFSEIDKLEGIEAKYISAPKYSITSWGRTQELTKNKMDEAINKLKEKTQKLGGKFEFTKA